MKRDIFRILLVFFVVAFIGTPLPTALATTAAYLLTSPEALKEKLSEPPAFSGYNYSGRFYKPLRSVAESQRILKENLVYMWTRWGAAVLLASAALWFETRKEAK